MRMWQIMAVVLTLTAVVRYGYLHGDEQPPKKEYRPIHNSIDVSDGNSVGGIIADSNVIQKDDKWVYTYTLTNVGKNRVYLVSWKLPDIAADYDSTYHLFLLVPKDQAKIVVTSNEPPVKVSGDLLGYKDKVDQWDSWSEKQHNIEIKGVQPAYRHTWTVSSQGYLPKSMLPKKRK